MNDAVMNILKVTLTLLSWFRLIHELNSSGNMKMQINLYMSMSAREVSFSVLSTIAAFKSSEGLKAFFSVS